MSGKIGILTFHRTTNFGSMLQTYGLYKKISELGYECEIIDYRCPAIEARENVNGKILSLNPKKLVRNIFFMPNYKKKAEALFEFSKENMKLGSSYTPDNIHDIDGKYEKYIVGSDIVWGRDITDDDYVYFLDFVKEKNKKYAFSASVGDYDYRGDEEHISKLLHEFSNIAVREVETIKWLRSLNISNVKWVCDPTMLLTANEWLDIVTPTYYSDDYVLIYFKDEQEKNIRDAIRYAKEHRLKVKMINYDRPYRGIENVKPYSLEDFFGLILNAKMIFTASYHGILFSIYFEKEFLFYIRSHKSRVLSLAKRLGIEDYCGNNFDVFQYDRINYEKVNKRLEDFRYQSIQILKSMLE